MKLIFKTFGKDIRTVGNTSGIQQILGEIKDGNDRIILFTDSCTGRTYIEKIKSNLLINPYVTDNLLQITDDEEFNTYRNAFKSYGFDI